MTAERTCKRGHTWLFAEGENQRCPTCKRWLNRRSYLRRQIRIARHTWTEEEVDAAVDLWIEAEAKREPVPPLAASTPEQKARKSIWSYDGKRREGC